MVMVVYILFFLIGFIYFIGLFLKWPVRPYVFLILLSCFLLFSNGFILAYKVGQQKNCAVLINEGSAQFEPLPDAATHFELTPGCRVKILKQEGDWVKVKRLDGKMGWIKKELVEKI